MIFSTSFNFLANSPYSCKVDQDLPLIEMYIIGNRGHVSKIHANPLLKSTYQNARMSSANDGIVTMVYNTLQVIVACTIIIHNQIINTVVAKSYNYESIRRIFFGGRNLTSEKLHVFLILLT